MKNNALAGLVMSAALLCTGQVWAGSQGQDWLWSRTSVVVNRSTEALASGHAARAQRFSTVAAQTTSATDRMIALHNLCIALLNQNKTEGAQTACRDALSAPSGFAVTHVRGALIVAHQGTDTPLHARDLASVIRLNIARAYGTHVVTQLVDDSGDLDPR
jgi:hypothetical protein